MKRVIVLLFMSLLSTNALDCAGSDKAGRAPERDCVIYRRRACKLGVVAAGCVVAAILIQKPSVQEQE